MEDNTQQTIPTAAEKLMDLKTYFKRVKASDGKKALNGYALWEDIPQVMIEFAQMHCKAQREAIIKNVKVEWEPVQRPPDRVDIDSIIEAYPDTLIK